MERVLNFLTKETSPKILKVIKAKSENEYNYYLREIYRICNSENNKSNKIRCKLYEEGVAFPSNMDAIKVVQENAETMNFDYLENETITLTNDETLNIRVKRAIVDVLSEVFRNKTFKNAKIRENFFVKEIVWLYELLLELDLYSTVPPTCIYYGEITEDESYLFKMLNLIGVKILYLNSKEDTFFLEGETITFEQSLPLQGFKTRMSSVTDELPLELQIKEEEKNNAKSNVITTWAKEAKDELTETLYMESGIFRPWAFRKGTTASLNIDAVIEDIENYWKEEARFRPEFKTEGDKVYVPTFFTKINGVFSDLKRYKSFIDTLRDNKLVVFKENFNLVQNNFEKEDVYSLAFSVKEDNIDIKELKSNKIYRIKNLNIDAQNFIIKKLFEFVTIYKNKIGMKEILFLVANVINMSSDFSYLIENFDFPYKIPKLIIYISDRAFLDKDNALFLHFFNLVGIDIIILTPNGSPSIEEYLFGRYLNIINLDEMEFDLTYNKLNQYKQRKSLFEKIFN